MILISHRGNIYGRMPRQENKLEYIDAAIGKGYDVEVDLWHVDNHFYLGHDSPMYEVRIDWLVSRKEKLWVHCKNVGCMVLLTFIAPLNFFWHENDTITLTSKKYIWALPGTQPIVSSIAVLPELYDDDISQCAGVCSDIISKYK